MDTNILEKGDIINILVIHSFDPGGLLLIFPKVPIAYLY